MLMRTERLEALIVAHRIMLSYLVKFVHEALPDEAQPIMMDQAQRLLHNTVEQVFPGPTLGTEAQMRAVAGQEIDRILTAPVRRLTPPDGRPDDADRAPESRSPGM